MSPEFIFVSMKKNMDLRIKMGYEWVPEKTPAHVQTCDLGQVTHGGVSIIVCHGLIPATAPYSISMPT